MQRKLTGVPPLTFVSNGENLVDYRIDGASGGVGDRMRNLFDKDSESVAGFIDNSGTIATVPNYPISTYDYINVLPNTYYSYKAFIAANPSGSAGRTIRVSYYTSNKAFISRYFEIGNGLTKKTMTTPNNCFYVRLSIDDNLENVMLWEGSSDVSVYEPYGCKIPIVCGGATTNIYLNEPLGENESISMNDTGLSIPTINGSNTLSVNTEVQPSSVYVKYATNERSVPARTYLQGVEKMDNWAIYNYINREGSGALKNESTVTSTTVEVRNTIQVTGAASGGTGSYQYAFYHKRSNAENWTTKSDYGAATTVEFSPYYVDTYKFKVNVKDSKGTIKSKIFNINVTAAASTTSNMPSLDKLSFENTDEPTVESDFNRADLTVEDNTPEEV